MRKAFDPQRRLGGRAILDVQLNLHCRDEIVPILRALQEVYRQPKLRDEILRLIEQDVNGSSSRRRGREGMDYWQILVLAAVRLGCNLDYDKLQDLAEQHRALRHLMGIGDWDDDTSFNWRRIRDNVCLIRPETIERINHLLVAAGHELVPEAAERARADSFVVETNIHYPTESTLIRDGLRKVMKISAALAGRSGTTGWRQHNHLYKKVKKQVRNIERIASRKRKGYHARLESGYRELLQLAGTITARAQKLRKIVVQSGRANAVILGLDAELKVFLERTAQVCDTARRRVLGGEQVPNEDKLFSIFEPHTQLYQRGKARVPRQFGRLALIFEDGAGFVTHYHLLARDAHDRDVAVEQTRILQDRLGGRLRRASFDRGFHTPENQTALAAIVAHPCLPMPGAKQSSRQKEEATVEFRQARQRHPGVESAIGALQSGNALARCRDRTERGFERYLGLAILGRNLHVFGKLLIARQDALCESAHSRRKSAA
jgi:IS5 family transposase